MSEYINENKNNHPPIKPSESNVFLDVWFFNRKLKKLYLFGQEHQIVAQLVFCVYQGPPMTDSTCVY